MNFYFTLANEPGSAVRMPRAAQQNHPIAHGCGCGGCEMLPMKSRLDNSHWQVLDESLLSYRVRGL
jgi:hypothetical protein